MIDLESSTPLKIARSPKRARVEPKTSEVESVDEAFSAEDDSNYEEDKSAGSEMENHASEDIKVASNAGWADVVQKILRTNKPKKKKTIILAKAKKLQDVKPKKEEISFEIDNVKTEVKSEEASIEKGEPITRTKSRRRETSLGIRVKPSITDRERERMLQKIATKGVVQLFNAVRQQQMEIGKKLSRAGPLERKREQVFKNIDKNSFLDILMGGTKSISVDNPIKPEETVEQTTNKDNDDKTWSVLRDDFVMGAKLKDWDKKDAEEEDSSTPEDMDSGD